MKVVWVSHTAGMLGAERAMIEGVTMLRDAGIECHIVLPTGEAVAPGWRALGLPVSLIPLPWWMSRRKRDIPRSWARLLYHLPRAARGFRTLFAEVRPDIVITNTLVIPFPAFAAKMAGIKHVWHIHEYGDRGLGFSFILGRFFSLKLVDRLSDTVIVNAKGVEAHFAGPIAPNKLRLLYYPLEAPPAPAAKAAAPNFRLVIMGSLSHKKRQEDAIRAMAILARRGVEARLAVVGPGSPEILHYLGGLAEELGVAGAVDFVGETDSPFDFFAAADIALICSLDEAFGRVTVEAMKMGTPVIGADSGGTSELISDGFNGLLFEPLNVEDLADKIERLVQDRDLLRRMGDNARRWARETFNSDKFEARLLGLLSEALGKESRAAGGASPPAAGR